MAGTSKKRTTRRNAAPQKKRSERSAAARSPELRAFDVRQFETTPSPMYVFDRETLRFLAVNDAALRLYRYERNEFLNLSLADTWHPSEDARPVASSERGSFPRHCGLRRHVKQSGDVLVADVVVQDIIFDGREAGLVLLLDRTERTRVKTRDLEREQLFSTLIEHSPDVIARIDRDLRHVYINPAVSLIAGVTAEQVMRGTQRDAGVPLELCVRWAAGVRRVFATGKQHDIEISFPTSDGERHYSSRMVPELDADGRVESVLAVARDITERKRAELALRSSERKLRETQREFEALADALPEVITCYDRELRHTYANGAYERVTGLSRAAMAGRTNAELGYPQPLIELLERTLQRVFETREASVVELDFTGVQGLRHYESRQIPLAREDGSVDSVICVAYDITERKRAEEDRLSVMSRQRDAFIREVHHRVKNNLQGVVGLLRQLGSMDSAAGPLVDKAVSQLQAMAVVHGLHGREWRDGVLLQGLLAEIAQSVERTAGAVVTLDNTAPAGAPLHVREKEAVAIALVVNELMLNAAKYTSAKTAAGAALAVSLRREGAMVRIVVANAGKLPPTFNYPRSMGLGTGLELVQALLPTPGAHLAFSAANGRVEAVLDLANPVIESGAESAQEMPHEWDRRQRPYSDRRR